MELRFHARALTAKNWTFCGMMSEIFQLIKSDLDYVCQQRGGNL